MQDAIKFYEFGSENPDLFQTDPKEWREKYEQFLRGLPYEDEFISLISWMGQCELIHKLGQLQIPPLSNENYQVPDLFVVVKYKDRSIPLFIEVKKEISIKLKLTQKYYTKLNNYAELFNLPILIAWRNNNLRWVVVDINNFTIKKTAFHLEFDKAIDENLMGSLFGDYSIKFPGGRSYILKAEKRWKDKYNPEYLITEVYFLNYKKDKIMNFPEGILYLMRFIDGDSEEKVEDNYLYKILKISRNIFYASQIHGLALTGLKERYLPEEIKWKNILEKECYKYSFHSLQRLTEYLAEKDLIQKVNQKTKKLPYFLKKRRTLKRAASRI